MAEDQKKAADGFPFCGGDWIYQAYLFGIKHI